MLKTSTRPFFMSIVTKNVVPSYTTYCSGSADSAVFAGSARVQWPYQDNHRCMNVGEHGRQAGRQTF
jgi:hypothetical protein